MKPWRLLALYKIVYHALRFWTVAASPTQHEMMTLTTNQDLPNEDRLDIARRIYRLMCLQYPDRHLILADSRGAIVARSDDPSMPLAGNKLSN